MTRRDLLAGLAGALAVNSAAGQQPGEPDAGRQDARNIATGWEIPRENYCDQPYVVITHDGNWLCVLTTGSGVEGKPGQHIIAAISSDKGRTWSPAIDIEPAGGPEASWVMPLLTPSGRVYALYTYNKDNIREIPLPPIGRNAFKNSAPGQDKAGRVSKRVDTLGAYVFKYSDDHGRTWSKERYEIPLRPYAIDRANNFHGKVLFFWGVGKPITHGNTAYFGWAKVGNWWTVSEGMVMRSDNVLHENDASKVRWEMLPPGDHGLRAPKSSIAEEANLVALSDGTLYVVYRTVDGYLCHAYSKDRGRTWTPPAYATYAPGGRRIKHPRAAGFVKKFSNGKYLLWYHNNGGEPVHAVENFDFWSGRNPGWVAGGIEKDGRMHWSEPEILVYDDDPNARISYPDFIEDHGRFFITETQKSKARVHEIDPQLLEGVWNQWDRKEVARTGIALDLTGKKLAPEMDVEIPQLPSLSSRGGFTLEFWLRLRELTPGQTILDTRDTNGKGIALATSHRASIELTLSDGAHKVSWDNDPGTGPGSLKLDTWQHFVFIVDGGPRIISVVVDGVLNDGGAVRRYGFGRFDPELADVNGAAKATLAAQIRGEVKDFRIYNRYLRTSEAVGNYRATRTGV